MYGQPDVESIHAEEQGIEKAILIQDLNDTLKLTNPVFENTDEIVLEEF